MAFLLLMVSLATGMVLVASLLTEHLPKFEEEAPRPRRRATSRTERIHGRILFVERYNDRLVLDCVAGWCHPAQCSLNPGTPFTLTVAPAGPEWFGEAVESMVVRWAEEDAAVEFLVVTGPDGERVDVRGERSRVRLDVRAHAGL